VRREIETALASETKLLPVLVRAASIPPRDVLPESLQKLSSIQAIEIRRDYWDHDAQLLLAQLGGVTAKSTQARDARDPFPASPYEPPDPIDEDKLERILENEMAQWTQVATPLPSTPGKVRVELTREYKFKSFQAAILFMTQVAPGCDIAMHHPRWENVWKTLTVYLSTWDGGLHRITDRDITLAMYFDRAFTQYDGAAREGS
jgi:pterin-4a-carbinolamine dehydratase